MKRYLDEIEIFADDIFEAVKIAEYFKKKGVCNLFRGQTSNWPLVSSMARPDVDHEKELLRLNKFANWVNSVKELQSVSKDYDKIMAIAQHYGIGTTFLDFTRNPKIAGFFATHNFNSKTNPKDTGTIICLNQSIFEKSWADINYRAKNKMGVQLARILELDVNNLWRLQAQEGVFLETRVASDFLEMFSFFKHIYFPQKAQPYDLVNEDYVYPKNKSHLEILLDEFFENDSRIKGLERAEKYFGKAITIGDRNFRGEPSVFLKNKLPKQHGSWKSKALDEWKKEPNEKHENSVIKIPFSLNLEKSYSIINQQNYIVDQLSKIVEAKNDFRNYSIDWNIKDETGVTLTMDDEDKEILEDDSIPQIECNKIVASLWDGLRRLPYTNDQIFACITNFLIGAKYGYKGIEEIFGKMTGVEFSTNIAINRSTVSDELLFGSIRDDFWELLKDEEREKAKSMGGYGILSALIDPKVLFDFPSFANLFVRNVIPMQPLYSHYDKIIYSPARIKIFGLS
ncbi:MAG TPA: FRG domain-containing protein [Saprospiraceae bacterium]|nr:FRG domain-containing protein [Saprospiraceae bacterium]